MHSSEEYDLPYPALRQEWLDSALSICDANLPGNLRRALKLFSNGVSAAYADDQFYFFWLVVEIVAVETKDQAKVPDACPKCRGPLFCAACNETPLHKPYPKQAIRDLISRTVTDRPDWVYSAASTFRNALMHGDEIEPVEQKLDTTFERIADIVGHVAFASLLTEVMNCMSEAGSTGTLPVQLVNRYVHYQVNANARGSYRPNATGELGLEHLPKFQFEMTVHEGDSGSQNHDLSD